MDEENQPFNAVLNETVAEFLEKQKAKLRKILPEDGKYECRRCGDCCKWNYYHLNIDNQNLIDKLYMEGTKMPHGYWVLIEGKMNFYMPTWKGKKNKSKLVHFDGALPPKHTEFLKVTGRMHGYWVLNKNDKVVVYSPTPCEHLTKKNMCRIYAKRPEICKDYLCGRYPV